MKRLLSLCVFFTIIIFGGCSRQPNIQPVVLIQDNHENESYSYQLYNKKVDYQVLGVYKDIDFDKLTLILNKMKEKINSQKKTFKKVLVPYSYDEEVSICKKRVFMGRYGRFRNSIERDNLLSYCMDKIFNERKATYSGNSSIATIKDGYLNISSSLGNGNNVLQHWKKVKILKIEKKIYLVIEFDRNNIWKDELVKIRKNLLKSIKDKNIIGYKNPKVDLNVFHELL